MVGDDSSGASDREILVRGGISRSLVYRLPHERIRDVDHDRRVVSVEVDVAEFHPYLHDDGTVHLYLRD